MTALLADEHIDMRVCARLRLLGHDVLHMHQVKPNARAEGPTDEEVLSLAAQTDRAVVTDNIRDFAALHRAGVAHAGIVGCPVDADWKRKAKEIDKAVREHLRGQQTLHGAFIRVAYRVARRRR